MNKPTAPTTQWHRHVDARCIANCVPSPPPWKEQAMSEREVTGEKTV